MYINLNEITIKIQINLKKRNIKMNKSKKYSRVLVKLLLRSYKENKKKVKKKRVKLNIKER